MLFKVEELVNVNHAFVLDIQQEEGVRDVVKALLHRICSSTPALHSMKILNSCTPIYFYDLLCTHRLIWWKCCAWELRMFSSRGTTPIGSWFRTDEVTACNASRSAPASLHHCITVGFLASTAGKFQIWGQCPEVPVKCLESVSVHFFSTLGHLFLIFLLHWVCSVRC